MKNPIIAFWLLFIPVMIILNGCSKDDSNVFTDLPVVESYLIPGEKVRVAISQKTPYQEDVSVLGSEILNLKLVVEYQDVEYILTPLDSGVYEDASGLIPVLTDSTYTLSFTYHEQQVTSYTVIPSVPVDFTASDTSITFAQFDYSTTPTPGTSVTPITLSWENEVEDYYMVTVTCIDSNATSVIKDSIPADDIFTFPPFTGDELELHPRMFKYFGRNRVVLYHLNPEYSSFFSQPVSTTQNYQDPPTNIVNGLGIFTGLNTDTLYIRVIQE